MCCSLRIRCRGLCTEPAATRQDIKLNRDINYRFTVFIHRLYDERGFQRCTGRAFLAIAGSSQQGGMRNVVKIYIYHYPLGLQGGNVGVDRGVTQRTFMKIQRLQLCEVRQRGDIRDGGGGERQRYQLRESRQREGIRDTGASKRQLMSTA